MSHTSTITRKGQVTIPIDIRRELELEEGDQLSFERQGETILVRRSEDYAERTAGILANYRLSKPLTPDEEREEFGQALADEVFRKLNG